MIRIETDPGHLNTRVKNEANTFTTNSHTSWEADLLPCSTQASFPHALISFIPPCLPLHLLLRKIRSSDAFVGKILRVNCRHPSHSKDEEIEARGSDVAKAMGC